VIVASMLMTASRRSSAVVNILHEVPEEGSFPG
jgi:hypothetical protein